jgi:tripartite-type tricarboxylate transporter receptor subunit TctC
MKRSTSGICAAAILVAAGLSASPVAADAVSDFYKGKRMKVIVGVGAGGTYDLFARIWARHVIRHIPGGPTMIVQNMPGSGSVKATNYMYNVAAKDGSVLGMPEQGVPVAQALRDDPGMKFDITRFNWIGVISQSTYLFGIWHKTPVKNIDDAKKQTVRMSSTGANSTTNIYPRLANAMIGTKFLPVLGYKGAGGMNMAIEQGETWGRGGTWSSWKTKTAHWVRDKKLRFVLQIGLKQHPDFKHVPLLLDLVKDPELKGMVEFMSVPTAIGRSIMAPPGVPAARVAALRKAHDDTVKDPAYQADIRAKGLEARSSTGVALQALMVRLSKTPKSMVAKVRKAIGIKKAKRK